MGADRDLHPGVPARTTAPGRRPVRVLFLNTATVPPLGADTWVHAQLMRDLDRSAVEVHTALVTGPPSAPTPTYEILRDVPGLHILAVDLGPERFDRSWRGRVRAMVATLPAIPNMVRLARYIRRHRIDVIHTSDRPRDAVASVLLRHVTSARSLIHCHVSLAPWTSRPLRWAMGRADRLVAVSEFVGRTLVEGGIDPARVSVVTNGIRLADWTAQGGGDAIRRELGIGADEPVVVTACRLFPGKGPGDLIRAVTAITPTVPDAHLLVVGHDVTGGEYTRELSALIEELGVGDRVVLTGRRADIRPIMAAADVFAMPSTGEPFGLVFAEAMAMGIPVVALGDGGTPEVVEDGRTGLLSAHGDAAGLAANLERLLLDPELRATMGAAGRRRVEERFTTERMAVEAADVYSLVAFGEVDRAAGTRDGS